MQIGVRLEVVAGVLAPLRYRLQLGRQEPRGYGHLGDVLMFSSCNVLVSIPLV